MLFLSGFADIFELVVKYGLSTVLLLFLFYEFIKRTKEDK